MTALLVNGEAFAGALSTELEGRMEVMADDGLKDSPDYADCASVLESIGALTNFPARVDLSSAEAAQAGYSIEGVLDWNDEADVERDARAALKELSL